MMPSTIHDLFPAPYNPRVITKTAFQGLRVSLDTFGDLSGIVFNTRTGHLVSGHQRVEALKAAGVSEIETDATGSFIRHRGEKFRVRFVDWDEDTEKLANVTANNPKIQGDWSDDLGVVLDDITTAGGDLLEPLQIGTLTEMLIHGGKGNEQEPKEPKEKEAKQCPHCGGPL